MWISWRMKWWSWMWFKQGQIEVECGDENDYGTGECGDEGGDGHAKKDKRYAGSIVTGKQIGRAHV